MKKLIFLLVVALSLETFAQPSVSNEYFDNGNIKVQVQPTGKNTAIVKKYDVQGNLTETGTWKNGLKDKSWVSYDSNGKVAVIGNFVEGVREGAWLILNTDGTIKYEVVYEKNRVISATDWNMNIAAVDKPAVR